MIDHLANGVRSIETHKWQNAYKVITSLLLHNDPHPWSFPWQNIIIFLYLLNYRMFWHFNFSSHNSSPASFFEVLKTQTSNKLRNTTTLSWSITELYIWKCAYIRSRRSTTKDFHVEIHENRLILPRIDGSVKTNVERPDNRAVKIIIVILVRYWRSGNDFKWLWCSRRQFSAFVKYIPRFKSRKWGESVISKQEASNETNLK